MIVEINLIYIKRYYFLRYFNLENMLCRFFVAFYLFWLNFKPFKMENIKISKLNNRKAKMLLKKVVEEINKEEKDIKKSIKDRCKRYEIKKIDFYNVDPPTEIDECVDRENDSFERGYLTALRSIKQHISKFFQSFKTENV